MLDLAMQGHQVWLEDFLDHIVPLSPFALLVAEAMGDCKSTTEWEAFTGSKADENLRAAMLQEYRESVWPKFVKRYGLSLPLCTHPGPLYPLPSRW